MKAKIFAIFLFFNVCPAFVHSAENRILVSVRDERGQLLMSTHAVRLSRGRVAVPVTAYERLSLFVRRQVNAKRVAIAIPDSDVGIWLYAGGHRVRSFETGRLMPIRYDTPVAILRGGRFYANASVVDRAFNDIFTTTWDKRTHAVVLQRKEKFGQGLHKLK